MFITVLGLGEAGGIYASGLASAGAAVSGYDPFIANTTGIRQVADISEAVCDADVVISLVGASAAKTVASAALPAMSANAVYADFNTAAPQVKAELSTEAAAHGIAFADVAVLAPVPRDGSRTPLLASGDGAETFGERMRPLAVPVETIDAPAGAAAGRKLVRSVFMKGLAGVVLESAAAGDAAGCGVWIHEQMASELGPGGSALVERLRSGSLAHAVRRMHEVDDAGDYLGQLGVPTWMTQGAHAWLAHLATSAQVVASATAGRPPASA